MQLFVLYRHPCCVLKIEGASLILAHEAVLVMTRCHDSLHTAPAVEYKILVRKMLEKYPLLSLCLYRRISSCHKLDTARSTPLRYAHCFKNKGGQRAFNFFACNTRVHRVRIVVSQRYYQQHWMRCFCWPRHWQRPALADSTLTECRYKGKMYPLKNTNILKFFG